METLFYHFSTQLRISLLFFASFCIIQTGNTQFFIDTIISQPVSYVQDESFYGYPESIIIGKNLGQKSYEYTIFNLETFKSSDPVINPYLEYDGDKLHSIYANSSVFDKDLNLIADATKGKWLRDIGPTKVHYQDYKHTLYDHNYDLYKVFESMSVENGNSQFFAVHDDGNKTGYLYNHTGKEILKIKNCNRINADKNEYFIEVKHPHDDENYTTTLYDIKGKKIKENIPELGIKLYSSVFCVVRTDFERYEIYWKTKKLNFDKRVEDLDHLDNDFLIVKFADGTSSIINTDNKVIIKGKELWAKVFDNKFIVTKSNNDDISIYDFNGNKINLSIPLKGNSPYGLKKIQLGEMILYMCKKSATSYELFDLDWNHIKSFKTDNPHPELHLICSDTKMSNYCPIELIDVYSEITTSEEMEYFIIGNIGRYTICNQGGVFVFDEPHKFIRKVGPNLFLTGNTGNDYVLIRVE